MRMFTLFIRGAVLYMAMILVMRGMGKRQLGEFEPFELAMTILLAEVIAAPMESVSDLLEGLRGAGFLDPDQVGTAIVEANGTISAFADSRHRAPGAAELGVETAYEGLPLTLIAAGRVQRSNLERSGRNEAWLRALLGERGLAPERVLLASLDTGGQLSVQVKGGGTMKFAALPPEGVAW